MKIPNLHSFLAWISHAKISSWKASDKELTESTRPTGIGSVGSYAASNPDGRDFKGIKITLPLPEPKIKK